MGKIIKPTLDDIAEYASFEPKPSMIGAGKRGAVVADETSGLAGRLKPRLQERFYPSGRLYTVEFALENPVPFSDVSDRLSNSYNTIRGRWQEFKQQHPYIAGAVKAGIAAGTAGGLMLLAGCGGGNGTPEPEGDTTPPAAIDDLEAIPSATKPERASLEFTSTGDDGYDGDPSWFLIKYAFDNPITSENAWENAEELASVSATKTGGAFYSIPFDVPPGNLCFAVRTYDDADNISGLSNSPCAQVISKAEDYVDTWIGNASNIYLFYPEVVAMVQGDSNAGIDSKAMALANELYDSDPQFPGTVEELRDYLLMATNGIYESGDGEFINWGNGCWFWDNDDIGDPTVRTYWEPDAGVVDFAKLPQQNMENIHSIMRDILIKYVDSYSSDYGNLEKPYCNPGWLDPGDKSCTN